MNVQPILILPFNYNAGLAFEGKNAAEFLKLLSTATMVTQTSRHGSYDWYACDPDECDSPPNIQFRTTPIREIECHKRVKAEMDELKKKLSKHADMIEAAEALAGGES